MKEIDWKKVRARIVKSIITISEVALGIVFGYVAIWFMNSPYY